uniref:Peptidase M12B propeptide domain-containing protein n=1 Tax=Hippocampus comes TaxID=109280 RepID=A0A3Q2YG94_HIPCM
GRPVSLIRVRALRSAWCLFDMATCVADALTRRLKEYGLVTPFSTDAHGRFLSHLLSASHKQRVRREASAAPPPAPLSDRLYFNISAFGKEFHLRLRPNRRLVAPGATVEWHDERGTGTAGGASPPLTDRTGSRRGAARIGSLETDCAFVGDIADVPGASVAMSNCDGLVSVPVGDLTERARPESGACGRVVR